MSNTMVWGEAKYIIFREAWGYKIYELRVLDVKLTTLQKLLKLSQKFKLTDGFNIWFFITHS